VQAVSWSSSNTDVATVQNGRVTAQGYGTATITVASVDDPGKKATCVVTVRAPVAVERVKLPTSPIIVYTGNSVNVTYSVSPSNATDKTVEVWTLSPEKAAAELTPEGKVRVSGLQSGSNVLCVKAIDGGITAQADIIVVDQVTAYYMYTIETTTTMYSKLGNGTITKFSRSQQVTILGTVGNWYYVYCNRAYGFISTGAGLETSKYKGQILEFWKSNPANYAGIFDTEAYVNDRYGPG
jgi:uncharacterized protein YjdB